MIRPDELDLAYAKETCRIGQGADCCRYLTMGAQGWSYEKNGPMKGMIDGRVELGLFTAQGDNCEGTEPPALDNVS